MQIIGETRSETRTRWQRQGETDVPVEMTVQIDNPERKSFIEYTLNYDWKSTNKPIDPVYFDYHSFQDIRLGLSVKVIDSRDGKSKILDEWTGKDVLPLPHDKKEVPSPVSGK